MDDKMKTLRQEWDKTKAALKSAELRFRASEQEYAAAVATGNRTKMAAATEARSVAANRLREAQVNEASARYLCGEDYARDSLRKQTGEDHSMGSVKVPGYF
jgi:hypothetical protein